MAGRGKDQIWQLTKEIRIYKQYRFSVPGLGLADLERIAELKTELANVKKELEFRAKKWDGDSSLQFTIAEQEEEMLGEI